MLAEFGNTSFRPSISLANLVFKVFRCSRQQDWATVAISRLSRFDRQRFSKVPVIRKLSISYVAGREATVSNLERDS